MKKSFIGILTFLAILLILTIGVLYLSLINVPRVLPSKRIKKLLGHLSNKTGSNIVNLITMSLKLLHNLKWEFDIPDGVDTNSWYIAISNHQSWADIFILLAADVKISQLTGLGWRGISLVLVIMLILRPLTILAGTWGSELNLKQKTLLSWIAPRGIVAAAVASLFSMELEAHGFDGTQLQAMVFLLIILTVLQAGLTGGITAALLGLRKKTGTGWVILGVNPISRAIAKILTDHNEDVLCIDENPKECKQAEKDGIRVLYGNGLDSNMLYRAEIDSKAGIIGMTRNEEVNYLFSKKIKDIVKLHNVLGVVKNDAEGVTTDMVLEMGGKIACGRAFDIEKWSMLLERGHAEIQIWRAEIIKNQSLEIYKKEVPQDCCFFAATILDSC